MPGPSPSQATNGSFIACLPTEALSRILFHLDSPQDLHCASLVSRAWRATAVDPRLWEPHYWTFYRATSLPSNEEEQLLLNRRTAIRRRAMRAWVEMSVAAPTLLSSLEAKTPSYPPFLTGTVSDGNEGSSSMPPFHDLFVRRMNADQRLLDDLRAHISLDVGILDNLLRLVGRYGDQARDILTGLSADQQINVKSVVRFATSHEAERRLRALDVHTRTAIGQQQLCQKHCIALSYAAQQLLGHLQRRESVLSMQQLHHRFTFPSSSARPPSLKERVKECSLGVEEALEDMALFRFTERGELREYLDVIALYVWTDMEAQARRAEEASERIADAAEVLPQGSTRKLLAMVEQSLRSLGFCVAEGAEGEEINSRFINVSALCPAQRATSPFIMGAILCAVARRLGITASLVDVPVYAMILVIEEGAKPEGWSAKEQGSVWDRFYFVPGKDGRTCIHEAGSDVKILAKSLSAMSDTSTPLNLDFGKVTEPASPLATLKKVGEDLLASATARIRYLGFVIYDERIAEEEQGLCRPNNVPGNSLLRLLHDYLLGRSSNAPWPLAPPVMRSCLVNLPPTRSGAPRFTWSPDLERLCSYCVQWIFRATGSAEVDGTAVTDYAIMEKLAADAAWGCDVALVFQVNGSDVQRELREARGRKHGADTPSEAGRPSPEVRQLVANLLTEDKGVAKGVGGNGANQGQQGQRKRELLNGRHSKNKAVKHGIGTIFVHGVLGNRCVIIGWDSACDRKTPRGFGDLLPVGGYEQPFYHVCGAEGTRRYVAQGNVDIEGARIPPGATEKEAAAILRQLVPLFIARSVGRCFETIKVVPWKEEEPAKKRSKVDDSGGAREGGGKGGGATIRMVMNPWMRKAWPFG